MDPTPARRRTRRRASAPQGPPPQPTSQPPVQSAAPAAPAHRGRRRPNDGGERALRDLVGAGRSQLGVSGALRGRDVSRPTDEDLAEAEREIVLVRRNWKPPAT